MMASEFQKAISEEQFALIVLEVYEHVRAGTLTELKVAGVARDIIEKRDDDGELAFYDARFPDEKRALNVDTVIGRIRIIIQKWKVYLAPLMEPLLIEATYQHCLKAKDSPSSFKTAAALIIPPESGADESKPAISPRSESILRRGREGVGASIRFGKDYNPGRAGDNGHECADTVHPVADGQRQDITIEMVSFRDDIPVHGVPEGDDPAQGNTVSDAEVSPEDPVDNDGGNGVGTPE